MHRPKIKIGKRHFKISVKGNSLDVEYKRKRKVQPFQSFSRARPRLSSLLKGEGRTSYHNPLRSRSYG